MDMEIYTPEELLLQAEVTMPLLDGERQQEMIDFAGAWVEKCYQGVVPREIEQKLTHLQECYGNNAEK